MEHYAALLETRVGSFLERFVLGRPLMGLAVRLFDRDDDTPIGLGIDVMDHDGACAGPKGWNEPEILTMTGRACRASKRLHPQNALLSKDQSINLDDQGLLCPISNSEADCLWGT